MTVFSETPFRRVLNSKLLRLVKFAAWFGACEYLIGFLAHAAGDVAPTRFDFFRRSLLLFAL